MLLTRKYHFYAAHRNQELCDKCRNIHGHQYEIRVIFDLLKKTSITTLFNELDEKVKPIIDEYDHGMLIDIHDPLYEHLKKFGEPLKFKLFNGPTSVENMAEKLFFEIRARTGLNVDAIEVDETKSSTLRFSRNDAILAYGGHSVVFASKNSASALATVTSTASVSYKQMDQLVEITKWKEEEELLAFNPDA